MASVKFHLALRRIAASLWLALLALSLPGTPARADVPVGHDAVAAAAAREGAARGEETSISPVTSEVPFDLRVVEVAELGITIVQLRLDRRHPSLQMRPLRDYRPRHQASWSRAARARDHAGVLGDSRCAEDTAFDATPPPAPPRAS